MKTTPDEARSVVWKTMPEEAEADEYDLPIAGAEVGTDTTRPSRQGHKRKV